MKLLSVILLSIISGILFSQDFSLEGTLTDYPNRRLFLADFYGDQNNIVDSAYTNEEGKKVKQLYEDNAITEQIEVTRQYQGKSYTVTIGEIDGRATTNIDTGAIFDKYKSGEISEKDIRKMFESVTKGAVEKTLGDGATMFFTTETPKEVKIKL